MAWVTLRRFRWTIKANVRGVTEVAEITQLPGLRRLPVNLSEVISTNALATPVHRPILYKATQNELRLLGSYLQHGWRQQIRLLDQPFHASSRQIRGFVSESFGLGMLTATVQAAYRWNARGQMFNVDALPTVLAGTYASRRTRPDLLFDLPTHRLAGEARGRSRRPPRYPLKEHYQRLNRLLPWAEHHHHPLLMTWTYVTGDGTTVDLFTPDTGVAGMDDPVGDEIPTEAATERDPAVAWPADRAPGPGGAPIDRYHEEVAEESRPRASGGFDHSPPDDVAQAVRHRRDDIEQQLFATAPPAQDRVAGHSVRGEWQPLDLVGQSTGSLLLALLDEPLSPSASSETMGLLRQRMRRRASQTVDTDYEEHLVDEPNSVTIRGRLLVAIASDGISEPWRLIADDVR